MDFSSCKAQFNTCQAFVKAMGAPTLTWCGQRFDDEGRSGATLDRPAFAIERQPRLSAADSISSSLPPRDGHRLTSLSRSRWLPPACRHIDAGDVISHGRADGECVGDPLIKRILEARQHRDVFGLRPQRHIRQPGCDGFIACPTTPHACSPPELTLLNCCGAVVGVCARPGPG